MDCDHIGCNCNYIGSKHGGLSIQGHTCIGRNYIGPYVAPVCFPNPVRACARSPCRFCFHSFSDHFGGACAGDPKDLGLHGEIQQLRLANQQLRFANQKLQLELQQCTETIPQYSPLFGTFGIPRLTHAFFKRARPSDALATIVKRSGGNSKNELSSSLVLYKDQANSNLASRRMLSTGLKARY